MPDLSAKNAESRAFGPVLMDEPLCPQGGMVPHRSKGDMQLPDGGLAWHGPAQWVPVLCPPSHLSFMQWACLHASHLEEQGPHSM